MYDLISLSHLYGFVVLDHDFIETIAENSDLAHHWVVIVVKLLGFAHGFVSALLKLVELLALSCSLAFKVIKLAAFNSQIFLNIALSFSAISRLVGSHCLLLELAFKNFIFLFQRIKCLLILSFLFFAVIHLSETQALDLLSSLMKGSQVMQ